MIEERSLDGAGYARFSDCRKFRYNLQREITPGAFSQPYELSSAVVFVMLNPSTADAFKVDPTVRRCVKFAKRWGADVLEVVNLFALRSSKPAVLYDDARVAPGQCGDYSHLWRASVGADSVNDKAIMDACDQWGTTRVIVAFGNHGTLADRGDEVIEMLRQLGIGIEALRVSPTGVPMHPLARGKSWIPDDVVPEQIA